MTFYTQPLSPALWPEFVAYFEHDGTCSGCWCMNHRYAMGLDVEGPAAKMTMQTLVHSGRVFGVLAYAEGESVPVGWCALDRTGTLVGHDCVFPNLTRAENQWSIHCLTTRKDFRDMGIESLLTEAAETLAKSLGAKHLEAYPEPGSSPTNGFTGWNTFGGHASTMLDRGFVPMHDADLERAQHYTIMQKLCGDE